MCRLTDGTQVGLCLGALSRLPAAAESLSSRHGAVMDKRTCSVVCGEM